MTFDPLILTTTDRIRLAVGDTSNDGATEYFPDDTYEAAIARYTNWKYAAADMAEAVAVQLDQQRTAFTAPGDIAVSWGDRAKTLRALAVRLRNEAAAEDAAGSNVMTSVQMVREGSTGAEYSPARYRQLRR